jgi:S-adenosylmethionine hydrolase
MKGKSVFIISDCTDIAINEIRCSIYKHTSDDCMFKIEPAINVIPFNLTHCAFQTRLIADIAPPGSILYIVCNPIQEETERVIGYTKKAGFIFIGRNTGVFDWLTQDFGIEKLFEINDPGFLPFGGKFIYPELIGDILSNREIKEKTRQINIDRIKTLRLSPSQILHIDNFGLLKINLTEDYLINHGIQLGDVIELTVEGITIEAIYTNRMMSKQDGHWTIYKGSSLNGLLEIGKVREDGNAIIKGKVGSLIQLRKKTV